MTPFAVTDESFEAEVLNSDKPVLLDFWAEWCGPCKMIASVLEEIAAERDDLRIAKLDIDDNPETPTKFGVRGIPTLILFKDGEAAATHTGAVPKHAMVEWLNKELA